jgi:hypothetical protein
MPSQRVLTERVIASSIRLMVAAGFLPLVDRSREAINLT